MENQPQKKPENYLILAILSTIFCCQITGVVSIIYAAKVNELFYRGEYEESKRASKNALTWAIIGASILFVFLIIYFAIFGFAIFTAANNGEFNF